MKQTWADKVEENSRRRGEIVRKYGSWDAYELAHLDYQALIVVASMQQAFEERGILEYARVEEPEAAKYPYIELYEQPILATTARQPNRFYQPSYTDVEVLEVAPFQFQKKLKHLGGEWWQIAVYRCYLAISHRYKKVLYFVAEKPEIVDAPLHYVRETFDNTGPCP